MKRILITGAAGFIGFHLARRLKERGDFCIGLDNFNSYYDVSLKKKRAEILLQEGIDVIDADIRNQPIIDEILNKAGITHVAHLAAQAGVRHSISHPNEYVGSNLQGFVSMLEACRLKPKIKFIYASSSSVYGLNQKVPFSVDDATDLPANLYGATKKSNELMAHAYHHLYGLSVTALRYFTVYGPWGRPDMAYYRFCRQICAGEPIQVYNQGKMRRDFTYIDDIVQGTIAAIDLGAPCEIFNLGNHCPIDLLHLIDVLENALGKKAMRHMLPMQSGEVIETFADISKSQKLLHFQPKISFEEGMRQFLDWFTQYHGLKVLSGMQQA